MVMAPSRCHGGHDQLLLTSPFAWLHGKALFGETSGGVGGVGGEGARQVSGKGQVLTSSNGHDACGDQLGRLGIGQASSRSSNPGRAMAGQGRQGGWAIPSHACLLA